jgi:uncharacterized protein (TIGR03083 family)
MASGAAIWNFTDPASKDNVLGVLQREIDAMFDLVRDESRWDAPTACAGWQVRDVVGHLVDATEGYLPSFEIVRTGGTPAEPLGLRAMAARADEHAKAFRKVPQGEMLDRLRDASARAMEHFESLTEDDWTSLMVAHPYMGPVPAMFYPMFQLVDYAVHAWDIREGTGEPHALAGDAADLLVPVIFILWQATADTSAVEVPYTIGVRTSGRNGGDLLLDVTADGLQFAPADIDDCPAILEFDPASLVLTGYGRMNGGTVRGDRHLVGGFRSLFFAI